MANPATLLPPSLYHPQTEPPAKQRMLPYYARRIFVQPMAVNLALRLMGARAISGATLNFIAQGMAANDVRRALARARGVNNWLAGWTTVAAEREQEGHALMAQGHTVSAAQCYFYAALAYHFAQFIYFNDLDAKHEIHQRSVVCYQLATRMFDPPAVRVEIPFRNITMPGYLRLPRGVTRPPVIVNVNGAAMAKEQFYTWENEFLARGMATLSYDGPGHGEGWHKMAMVPDYSEVGIAILDWLSSRSDVDGDHVAFNGVSLGGYLAIAIASRGDPRVRSISTICSPYDIAREYRVVMPMVRREIRYLFRFDNRALRATLRVVPHHLARKVSIPTLVISGGHDIIVPPRSQKEIYADLAGKKQLLFYPNGGHICYEAFPDLRMKLADWFATYIH